jgi:REP element-mobilizing transposase RayT
MARSRGFLQLELPTRASAKHGGRRDGAGRPRTGKGGVRHRQREALASRHPVHVTLKLRRDAPRLRGCRSARVLRSAIRAGSERLGLRVVHYSIQSNHVHLVCEAKDAQALSRGIQGLEIRMARRLNRAHGRTGRVWADRYHARILRTPREVRNCLVYVLGNWRHHGGAHYPDQALDPHSSAAWFDGFREKLLPLPEGAERPTAAARTWLLGVGWRKRGLISVAEAPSD